MTRGQWLGLAAVAVMAVSLVRAEEPPPASDKTPPIPKQAELDKEFEKTLTGATLVGYFTTAGKDEGKSLKPEKYTINKVSKLQGDYWLFDCRIQYGDHDAALPLPLRVVWAGDTPVITLTDMPVPGFGTFTCRVLIYRDQYAGTWSGANHGGHLFGHIERAKVDEKK